jgi:hypothetical protein
MHSTQTPLDRSRFKFTEKLRNLRQLSSTFGWPRVYIQLQKNRVLTLKIRNNNNLHVLPIGK